MMTQDKSQDITDFITDLQWQEAAAKTSTRSENAAAQLVFRAAGFREIYQIVRYRWVSGAGIRPAG